MAKSKLKQYIKKEGPKRIVDTLIYAGVIILLGGAGLFALGYFIGG